MDRNRGERGSRRRSDDEGASEFEERVVQINRVAKVHRGGRRFSFGSIVVVGDGKVESVPDWVRPTRYPIRFARGSRPPRSR